MTDRARPSKSLKRRSRKPPPRWRKYLVQAELELPQPPALSVDDLRDRDDDEVGDPDPLPWWQTRPIVIALALLALLLLVIAITALHRAAQDRAATEAAAVQVRTLTLRAISGEQTLRIAPNPRSWSTAPDASIAWPEPPQLLQLYLPVGYSAFLTFAVVVDKVDHGRVMVVERMTPDSNRELRLALNSSAFGPGEYRLRVQGYTWRGNRIDVGWVRLEVR